MGVVYLAIVFLSALLGFMAGTSAQNSEYVRAAVNLVSAAAVVAYILQFVFDRVFPAVMEETDDVPGKRDLKIVVLDGGGEVVTELSSYDHIPQGRKNYWRKKLSRVLRHGNPVKRD